MKFAVALLALSMSFAVKVFAQDIPVTRLPNEIFRTVKKDPNDTIQWVWKRSGLVNVNFSQASLTNWAAGGDNFAMSLNSYINYFVLHKRGRHTWDNNLDFNLGYIQTTSRGGRKNDDRVDFLSKYGYRVDTSNKIFASALFNFRSQLFDGRNYFTKDSSVLSSTFLSPAYVLISAGFDYKPFQNFSIFLSPLTSRYLFVFNNTLSKQGAYGVTPGKKFKNEIGAFASFNYFKPVRETVTYKGRMDLFSNYGNKPANVDVFMTNLFSFRINKFLSATYSLDLIYDDDVKLFGDNRDSPGLQSKSIIGIGFSMPFNEVIKKRYIEAQPASQ